MKTSLFITALVAASFTTAAAPLTPEQALLRARHDSRLRSVARTEAPSELVYTVTADGGNPAVYVFNSPSGFMVLSADDCGAPVLGYSDSGSFSPDEMAPALRWWLDFYGSQIAAASRSRGYSAQADTADYAPIAPLLATRWNQNEPYNNDCPLINGSRCVTGCVATAMAQVMKYHNWPEKGLGSKTYTSAGQTLTFDYANTSFDWDNMLPSYSSAATQAQNQAVASLMYAAGVSVSMSYGVNESGAAPSDIPGAMVNYLNYDVAACDLSRSWFTEEEWQDLIYTQLRDYGPVLYGGQSSDGGHQFVCDGYRSDGYFHINWGWGGMSDGYFLLSALDPESQGIGGSTSGYNTDQSITANVCPPRAGSQMTVVLAGPDALTASPSHTTVGSQLRLTLSFYNYSTGTIDGVTLGAMFIPTDGGTPIYVASQKTVSGLKRYYGFGACSYAVTVPADIADGNYIMRPAFQTADGNWHTLLIDTAVNYCYEVSVADGAVSLTPGISAPLLVDEFTIDSALYTSTPFKVTATVTNPNEAEYHGQIIGVLLVDGQIADEGASYNIDLEPGESTQIEYLSEFTHASAGEYTFTFLGTDPTRSASLDQVAQTTTVTLQQAPTENAITVTDLVFNGVESQSGVVQGVNPADVSVTFTAQCTEGVFYDALTVYVLAPVGSSDQYSAIASSPTPNLWLDAGQAVSIDASVDFADQAQAGVRYMLLVRGGNSWVSSQRLFTIVPEVTSIETISSDAGTPQFFTLQGIPVSNPDHGLYIMRCGNSVSKILMP